MRLDTLFDVASLTKVVSTTTAAMLLYQWGALDLDAKVGDFFGPAFAATDARKEAITVRHLLLHEAGFPPDPTPVSYCTPSFACPMTTDVPASERRLAFTCQRHILDELLAQTLATPAGVQYVYSDLSMITLMVRLRPFALALTSLEEVTLGASPSCVPSLSSGSTPPPT